MKKSLAILTMLLLSSVFASSACTNQITVTKTITITANPSVKDAETRQVTDI